MKFDSNNFIVDEIYTIRFFGKCPSCHEEYDSVEDEHGVITSPHFCPNCGFDIHKYNEETKLQSPWKHVTKDEFYEFVNSYPTKLDFDTTGIYDPPLSSYNDFTRGVWPDSMVAKIHRNDMLPEEWNAGENEYYLLKDLMK